MNTTQRKVNALNGADRYKLQCYVRDNLSQGHIRAHTYNELSAMAARALGFTVTPSNLRFAAIIVYPECVKRHTKPRNKGYVKLDPAELTLRKYTEIVGRQIDVAFGTVNRNFEDINTRVTALESFVTNPR